MPIYKLRPIDNSAENWRTSVHKGEVVLRAPSEGAARDAAVAAFTIAVTRTKGAEEPLIPPWREPSSVDIRLTTESGYPVEGPTEILEPASFNDELIRAYGEFEPHPENLMCWDRRTGCGYWFYNSDTPEQHIGLQMAKSSRPEEDSSECGKDKDRVGEMTEEYRRAAIALKRSKGKPLN